LSGKVLQPPDKKGNAAEVGLACKEQVCWAVREYLPDCHVYVERYRKGPG